MKIGIAFITQILKSKVCIKVSNQETDAWGLLKSSTTYVVLMGYKDVKSDALKSAYIHTTTQALVLTVTASPWSHFTIPMNLNPDLQGNKPKREFKYHAYNAVLVLTCNSHQGIKYHDRLSCSCRKVDCDQQLILPRLPTTQKYAVSRSILKMEIKT